jgi:hypothetical protein
MGQPSEIYPEVNSHVNNDNSDRLVLDRVLLSLNYCNPVYKTG